MPPLIDFRPPQQSWADYLDSLPAGATPRAQDIFDRWDAPFYVCPAYPRNGTTQEKAKHDVELPGPGQCKCGAPLRKGGLKGQGIQHAYLAWLAGMMAPEEAQHFWAQEVSASQGYERLIQHGIVPTVRKLFGWLKDLEQSEVDSGS